MDIYSILRYFVSDDMISQMGECAYQRLLFVWGFFVPALYAVASVLIPLIVIYIVFNMFRRK